MYNNDKEVIAFRASVPPLTQVKFSERVKGAATIVSVMARFYSGQQLALKVRPCVLAQGNKLTDLITYPEGTDQYLSGDDDVLPFEMSIPVRNDDELVVFAHNTDDNDAYTLVLYVTLDYMGGSSRVV